MKQHITRAELRNASYNAGGQGWNLDLYDLDGMAIIGGYRSFPKCTARVDYSDAKRIEKHIDSLKTKRGKIAAAIRLINRYAK